MVYKLSWIQFVLHKQREGGYWRIWTADQRVDCCWR